MVMLNQVVREFCLRHLCLLELDLNFLHTGHYNRTADRKGSPFFCLYSHILICSMFIRWWSNMASIGVTL